MGSGNDSDRASRCLAKILAVTLIGYTESVIDAAFSLNGRILATASNEKTVKLWDVADPIHPALAATLTGHTGDVFVIAFSSTGRGLAGSSRDKTVRLWNLS